MIPDTLLIRNLLPTKEWRFGLNQLPETKGPLALLEEQPAPVARAEMNQRWLSQPPLRFGPDWELGSVNLMC